MISQMELIGVMLKAIDKHGTKNLNARQMNAVIEGANVVMDALESPHVPSSRDMGLSAWLKSDVRGVSSMYMAYVLAPLAGLGNPWHGNHDVESDPNPYPYDPSDFARCIGLLEAVPELRGHLSALSEGHGPVWTALIGAWEELEALYAEEQQSGKAPKLYERMRQLREVANA